MSRPAGGRLGFVGPVWNVVICAVIFVGALVIAVNGEPFAYVGAAAAAYMEVIFIRRLLAAARTR